MMPSYIRVLPLVLVGYGGGLVALSMKIPKRVSEDGRVYILVSRSQHIPVLLYLVMLLIGCYGNLVHAIDLPGIPEYFALL